MSPDVSIIIAHRGEGLGLWSTIHSCIIELNKQDISFDFHIVSNGQKSDKDFERIIEFLDRAKLLGSHQHFDEPLTPPKARSIAAAKAIGRILCFFDNHILVDKDYFRRAVADFAHFDVDLLHSTTLFYTGEEIHYHYKLKLAYNFWAESSLFADHSLKPYRIAMAGHGGFFVKNSVWKEVGGYGPDGLFEGYGGEESYFDLKMALLDKTNWIDPKVRHYHYAGRRGYARHYTDDYYRNMLTCAYVIGGEHWMERVFESFTKTHIKQLTDRTWFDLMVEAYERGKDHAAELARKRKRTLDEQLQLFREQLIAYS